MNKYNKIAAAASLTGLVTAVGGLILMNKEGVLGGEQSYPQNTPGTGLNMAGGMLFWGGMLTLLARCCFSSCKKWTDRTADTPENTNGLV
jgi:hypothetical protein